MHLQFPFVDLIVSRLPCLPMNTVLNTARNYKILLLVTYIVASLHFTKGCIAVFQCQEDSSVNYRISSNSSHATYYFQGCHRVASYSRARVKQGRALFI